MSDHDYNSKIPGNKHPNLLDLGLILKRFPSLALGKTDIQCLREFELQAHQAEQVFAGEIGKTMRRERVKVLHEYENRDGTWTSE